MGTRSNIAVEYETGQVEAIYCHNDGYPAHNGVILFENYLYPSKIEALIALGALSALREEVGEKHPFSTYGMLDSQIDTSWKKWTTAYHRDRGEDIEDTKPDMYANVQEFTDYVDSSSDIEWAYLYRDGRWLIYDPDTKIWHDRLSAAIRAEATGYIESYQPRILELADQWEQRENGELVEVT